MEEFLDSLTAEGGTNINCPLRDTFQNITDNERASVYIFTDGDGNDACTEQEVTAAALKSRQNPNMMAYSMEIGEHTNPDFFKTYMMKRVSLIWHSLIQPTQSIRYHKFLTQLCSSRELWAFIDKERTKYHSIDSGHLMYGPTIDANTVIKRNHESVLLGTEQQSNLLTKIHGFFTQPRENLDAYLPKNIFSYLPQLSHHELQQFACMLTVGYIAHVLDIKCAGFMGNADKSQRSIAP